MSAEAKYLGMATGGADMSTDLLGLDFVNQGIDIRVSGLASRGLGLVSIDLDWP